MSRWHVAADNTVTAPQGRKWSGAPTHRAAVNLARSLAGVDAMLGHINQPRLTIVKARPPLRHYGFREAKRKCR